jgi:hypothetical protein
MHLSEITVPSSIQSDSSSPAKHPIKAASTLELAQALAESLTITSGDWHRLKANRKARALQQAAAAVVFLLKDQPQEALARLQQAVGWLDKSVTAPPCPTHGHHQAGLEPDEVSTPS